MIKVVKIDQIRNYIVLKRWRNRPMWKLYYLNQSGNNNTFIKFVEKHQSTNNIVLMIVTEIDQNGLNLKK